MKNDTEFQRSTSQVMTITRADLLTQSVAYDDPQTNDSIVRVVRQLDKLETATLRINGFKPQPGKPYIWRRTSGRNQQRILDSVARALGCIQIVRTDRVTVEQHLSWGVYRTPVAIVIETSTAGTTFEIIQPQS